MKNTKTFDEFRSDLSLNEGLFKKTWNPKDRYAPDEEWEKRSEKLKIALSEWIDLHVDESKDEIETVLIDIFDKVCKEKRLK